MSAGEPRRRRRQLLLAILALAGAFAAGASMLAGVAAHVWKLERLRRHGVAVHGWVRDKRSGGRFDGLFAHIVEYRYWPHHLFDKPYDRRDRAFPFLWRPGETLGSAIERFIDERGESLDPDFRRRLQEMARGEGSDLVRPEPSAEEPEPNPPDCPERDPFGGTGWELGSALVSGEVRHAVPIRRPVPVALIPGKDGLHTIGRVDRRRVWRVLLWRLDIVLLGLLLTGVCGWGLIVLIRQWTLLRRLEAAGGQPPA